MYKLFLQVNCKKTLETLNEQLSFEISENIDTEEFRTLMDKMNEGTKPEDASPERPPFIKLDVEENRNEEKKEEGNIM